jgi:hypothetical protein
MNRRDEHVHLRRVVLDLLRRTVPILDSVRITAAYCPASSLPGSNSKPSACQRTPEAADQHSEPGLVSTASKSRRMLMVQER